MRARRFTIALIVAAVAAAAAWWHWQDVRQQNNSAIRGSGIIEVTEVDVAFEVPGTIAERLVDEGALLDRGEPIARLDDREYRLQQERAAAAKAAADARYRLVLKGPRGQEIDQAIAADEAASTDLEVRQRDFGRIKKLFDSGVVSRNELDQTANALAAAQSQKDRSAAALAMMKEGSRVEEIEEARSRLHEAEKALEMADLNLARCHLFAPLSGRVLSKNREAGEMVMAGTSIVTMGDMQRPWLNLYISERDLGRVALGMPAEVIVDSFPKEPFNGKVAYIADKSEFTPKNIQTQDERVKLVYRVKIELQNRKGALKPGMPADAVIPLDHAP
ncbi:MAG: efflux RND transporter periplasmic adaptor subunit [Deltaproteobacteria bacterium]|nr:efflux RND transporter periplasmic adaptor subunit [Deltaproteobacteria bacterium]